MPRAFARAAIRASALAGAVALLGSAGVLSSPERAAADAGDGLQFGVKVAAHEAVVTGWDESAFPGGAVVIPEIVTLGGEEYPVTSIADEAFARELDGGGLTSVVIPDSIRTIGYRAFANNMRLASAPLPSQLVTIGDGAFSVTGITSVDFPPTLTTIGSYAFAPTRLQSVDIPETVTHLGDGIFTGSGALKHAILPDNLTTVPNHIFDSTGLEQITIPAGVTSIGAGAFDGTKLTALTIPEGVVTIGQYAFASIPLADVWIPDSVDSIAQRAFYGVCPDSVRLGARVRDIGEGAFNCPLSIGGGGAGGTIASTVIPASVESIGSYAFGSMHGTVDVARFLGDAPSLVPAPNGSFTTDTHVEFCSGASGFGTPTFAGHPSTAIACTMVTFEANDGTGRVAHQGSTTGSAPLRPNPFTPAGCNVFVGWLDDNGQWYDEDASYSFAASATFSAQWEAATVALVSYDANGGSGAPAGGGGFCGELLAEPTAPTKPGYDFAGWYRDAALTEPWDFANDRLEPRHYTLYAKWTPSEQFLLSYAGLAGASNGNPSSYTIDDRVELVPPGARLGYEFAGWTGPGVADPATDIAFGPAIMGDRTYTAHWTPVDYSIGYDLAGGVAGAPANATSYTIESPAITLAPPTRVGHTFAGWTGTGLSEATSDVTIPTGSTGNRSYTATWTVDVHTVAFDTAGGSSVPDAAVPFGGLVTEPTAPTRDGYAFDGWFRDAAATDAWDFAVDTVGDDDLVLHAGWTTVSYAITYDLDGGSDAGNPATYDVESAPLSLGAPSRPGYRFDGWTGGDIVTPTAEVTIPTGSTGNRAYTAHWTLEHYAISYNLAGGTATTGPTSYTVVDSPITLPTPVRAGYRFAGWIGTGLASPQMIVVIPSGSTGDRAFTATWQPLPASPAAPATSGSPGSIAPEVPSAPEPTPTPEVTPTPSATPSDEPSPGVEPSQTPRPQAEAPDDDQPAAFPWWGWVLVAAGVLALLVVGGVIVTRARA